MHPPIYLFESTEYVSYRVIAEARERLMYLYRSGVTREDGRYIRIIIGRNGNAENGVAEAMSTPFLPSAADALRSLMQKLGDLEEEYIPGESDDRKARQERQIVPTRQSSSVR